MKRFRLKFLFLLIPVFLLFGASDANALMTPGGGAAGSLAAGGVAEAAGGAATAKAEACSHLADSIQVRCWLVETGLAGSFDCTEVIKEQIIKEQLALKCQNILISETGMIQIAADDLREIQKQTWKDVIAGAWKSMLSVFSKQLAYDTASWIASGGKGQKPLFITEGIGAYLKNTADDAAGTFIDEIDKEFGVNLCRPNFNVELMIKTSLRGYKPRKPSCNFSGMVNNWQSAINNASFSVEYSNYLNASENDIGIYLKTSSALMDRVKEKTGVSALEASINNGFKDLKSLTGWILTPGTMIKNQHEVAQFWAGKQDSVFTGTVWDFVETFLNTLVGQLLQNLKDGYFQSGSGSTNNNGNNGFNLPNLSRFASLLNPQSAPYVEGSIGAQERFLNLIKNNIAIGGPYDILNKLTACTEANKINPGPTDCVIDPILSKAIREKTLIKDLPASILNRQFVPPIDNVNPQESFSLRNIVILRKYRIVPVGWEIAARYLSEPSQSKNKNYTLGDLIAKFNEECTTDTTTDPPTKICPPFQNLIDPQWVLKAPELFCRREGYGVHNDRATSQDQSVRRTQYCADEQQCISEDSDGNCKAYGYCTEERKIWDTNSPQCQPRFNTCQIFQSQNGTAGSYLANTLDYRDCNSGSAGCMWYSTLYNAKDSTWLNSESEKILNTCNTVAGCQVFGLKVDQWKQTAYSDTKGVFMAKACTTDGGCDFTAEYCTVPYTGVKCSLDKCLSAVNILTPLNSGFELSGNASWDARFWVESYQNDTNRQFRSGTSKHSGSYSLESLSFNNPNPLISTLLIDSGIEANKTYKLSFYIRGGISSGSLAVKVFSSTVELGSTSVGLPGENWQQYFVDFSTQNIQEDNKIEIRVITDAGTTGTVFFDDFDLRGAPESCAIGDVWLNLGSQAKNNSEIYFDRDAQACDSGSAGCSQFIRVKAGLGSNLIYDGSFEDYYGDLNNWVGETGPNSNDTSCAIFLVNSGSEGGKSIDLKADFTTNTQHCAYFSNTPSLSPFELINGKKYVLSGKIYIQEVGKYFLDLEGETIQTEPQVFATADLYKWITIDTNFVWNKPTQVVKPRLVIESGDTGIREAYFDAVKLEEVLPEISLPTAYTPYNPSQRPASQLTYLKKAPSYYDCYLTVGGDWPTNLVDLQQVILRRNQACSNYSSVCIASEMNCELYTPINRDPAVPGTITSADVCLSECSGYQVYKQESTNFVSAKYKQFINKDPIQTCSAAAAGCDEFTNLDAIDRGGEALEYYTQLRTCQKPDAYDDEATYYTWEGSDTTGYQLKVFTLKESNDTAGLGISPCTNISYPNDLNGNNICADPSPSNDPDTNGAACLATDLNSNPDCREFYDTAGNIHYRLLSRVIYADDNCHPYRRTQTQNDNSEAAQDCRVNQGYWNSFNECIYMAIPGQGGTCSTNLKGCREYTGNKGSSFKNIFLSNFESGTMGWQGGTVATEATHPGGNSLTNNTNASRKFSKPVLIRKDKSYSISFWAKGDSIFNLDSVRFSQAPPEDSFMVGHPSVVTANDLLIPITDQWNRYDLGPVMVSWGSNTGYFEQNVEINMPAGKKFYIDNILLKELPQSVYALENSWFTPFSCDNNIDEPYGTGDALTPERSNPGKMIGCQEYRDRSKQTWFLKSFENLCRADAVGCEQLIDTHNSDSYYGATFNTGDSAEVTVPNDNFVYMVNDAKYSCKSEDKGCTAIGLPSINNQDEVVGYNTSYIKNQPDRYSTDLCKASSMWCEEFVGSRSVSYFKDPRDRVCEYKTEVGETQAKWYKKGTNQLCDVTYLQTIGTGSKEDKLQPVGWFNSYLTPSGDEWPTSGNTSVPYESWVGLCPTDQNSCTEYIDPSTEVYKNEILNVKLDQDVDGNGTPDHWAINDSGELFQKVSLLSHTLYSFSVEDVTDKAYIKLDQSCAGIIVSPDSSLDVIGGNKASPKSVSGRLYVIYNSSDICSAKVFLPSDQPVKNLRLVRSGVYYSLSNKVDYSSCNGLVDYNSGCVLFNDRGSMNYSSNDVLERNANYLTFDADATYRKQMKDPDQKPLTPKSPTPPDTGDSNVILKVQPDRTCSSWLYCTTYEKDDPNSVDPIYGNNDRCLDLGLCASVDDKGVCNNFILKSGELATENYGEKDIYKTGYASVGKKNLGVAGYFPFYTMTQFGDSGSVTNGSFESLVVNSTEPLGWSPSESIDTGGIFQQFKSEAIGWHDYKFSTVTDIKSSPEGSRYLSLNSFYEAISEEIDVFAGSPYILSGWINSSGLNYPDGNVKIKSQIQYSQHAEGGDWGRWEFYEDTTPCTSSACGSLSLDSGLTWTKKVHKFTPAVGTDKIKIKLKTFVDEVGCNDTNKLTACKLGGVALFDDISLKPVLQVSDSDQLTDKYVSRSCRIYPAEDSLSCRYLEGNNLFYGSYGYCLLVDPSNSKQCLQWWPVDQLQGEVLNEVGGYNDRVPLDYCVDKSSFVVNFTEFGYALALSSQVQDQVAGYFDNKSGSQNNFTPFRVKDDYRPLFRFPYVDRIKVRANGVGITGGVIAIMIPVNHDMTYDIKKKEWKGWAAIPVCIAIQDQLGICIPIPLPYEMASTNMGQIISAVTGVLNGTLGGQIGFGPVMGLKVIEDRQGSGITSAGRVADPIPDLPGDILGVSWFVRSTGKADVVAITMTVSGDFTVSYCDKMVRVVTSSGENKAYANRVTQGSGYINKDRKARPDLPSTLLDLWDGDYYYYDPFDYNQFLDSIVNPLNEYIGETTFDVAGKITGQLLLLVENVIGTLFNFMSIPGVNLGSLTQIGDAFSPLGMSSYQSSDYQPFGAIVPPVGTLLNSPNSGPNPLSASPNPNNWSSRRGLYNMPLFYEPPRLGVFVPPYQARMGEEHSKKGLEQLFAQSYGEWYWKWNLCLGIPQLPGKICKNPDAERGGYYASLNTNDFLSIPTDVCNRVTREDSTNQPCYVKPKVIDKIINDKNKPGKPPTINGGVGLAKLAFTTLIDPDQLPVSAYTVTWGDGEHSKVSGVLLRNRTNIENPFLLYHLYDFWKVKSTPSAVCTGESCTIKVIVQVYDNWNKSNCTFGSNDENDCEKNDSYYINLVVNKN